MPNRDYRDERREYLFDSLDREQLHLDPFLQFSEWMDAAHQQNISDPTAMTLATVDADGQPHARIVLLKEFNAQGFVFYTHYNSAKAAEIDANPKASLSFFWPQMDRQIRIEGNLTKTSAEQSAEYFASRPRDSQLAALVSHQSDVVPGRKTLELNLLIADAEQGMEIPCPDHWGGYRLSPTLFEYWQGRPNRLHDRFQYKKHPENNQAWLLERLSP